MNRGGDHTDHARREIKSIFRVKRASHAGALPLSPTSCRIAAALGRRHRSFIRPRIEQRVSVMINKIYLLAKSSGVVVVRPERSREEAKSQIVI